MAIEHVMIDERTQGSARRLVPRDGLGIRRPLLWSALRHDEQLDVYGLNVTNDPLENAPPPTAHFFDTVR